MSLEGPQNGIVYTLLIAMAIGGFLAMLIIPPMLNKIDRTGKVGFFGF